MNALRSQLLEKSGDLAQKSYDFLLASKFFKEAINKKFQVYMQGVHRADSSAGCRLTYDVADALVSDLQSETKELIDSVNTILKEAL